MDTVFIGFAVGTSEVYLYRSLSNKAFELKQKVEREGCMKLFIMKNFVVFLLWYQFKMLLSCLVLTLLMIFILFYSFFLLIFTERLSQSLIARFNREFGSLGKGLHVFCYKERLRLEEDCQVIICI